MLPNSKHVATYPKRMVFALDADVPRFVDIRPVRDVIDVSNMSTPPSSVFGSEFFSSRLRTRLRTAKPGADIGLQLTVEHLAKNARLAKGISIDHLGDKLFSSKELERKDSKIWIVGGKHKNH